MTASCLESFPRPPSPKKTVVEVATEQGVRQDKAIGDVPPPMDEATRDDPPQLMICLLKRVSFTDSLMSIFIVSSLFYTYSFSHFFTGAGLSARDKKNWLPTE